MRNWRINLFIALFFALGGLLIARLFFLQIRKNDFYSALAQGQQSVIEPVLGSRGDIFCQDKQELIPLALDIESEFAYALPKEVPEEEKEEIIQSLVQILNLEKEKVLEELETKTFVVLKKKLSEPEVESLKTANLSGVYHRKETLRSYPENSLASHVIGFVDNDGEGKYGTEAFYNEVLKGKEGFKKGERGILGYIFFPETENTSGKDLFLTLDYNIQYKAERLLEEAREQLSIEEGQILVINPKTGAILALAEFPNFDLNEYSKWSENMGIFKCKVVQELFEPGSVFKAITMGAALDAKAVTPDTTYIDTGEVSVPGGTIFNYDTRVWGEKTMREVLEKSINTGAVFVEQQMGHKTFLDYIEKFGIFEKTGIDLSGEVFSENREFKKGYEINFATASFGQGIEMTPVQLARAFGVIANSGKLVNPRLVKDSSLSNIEGGRQVISRETTSKLTEMLVGVLEEGFAKSARVPGYYIAGKTGTAQVPLEGTRGYHEDKTIQSFIGFFPAYNPQFLVLVKLDNPQTKTAEYSAVPIFQKIAKYIIDYWQIAPDYEENSK